MDAHSRPSKTYQSHRESQRERILEVAERLFIRDGIDRVSLTDIARAARITRNTLYEYFPNKQEILWAIFQALVDNTQSGFTDRLLKEGSGFQRVENFMRMFINMLETNPEHLRFIVEFNTLYAREGNPIRVRQIRAESGDVLTEMFRQGIADGSIRPDLDPDLLAAATLNLLNGVSSRFALLGDLIHEEYGQPVMAMYREICRAFLRGIQPNPSLKESIE